MRTVCFLKKKNGHSSKARIDMTFSRFIYTGLSSTQAVVKELRREANENNVSCHKIRSSRRLTGIKSKY